MKPIEILQALKDGKKVRGKNWEKGYFIYLKDGLVVEKDNDRFDIYRYIHNEINYNDCSLEPNLNFEIYEDCEDKTILLIKNLKYISDSAINENKNFFHYQMMENVLHEISKICEQFLKEKQ